MLTYYLATLIFMLIMLASSCWLLIASFGLIQTKRAGAFYVPTDTIVLTHMLQTLHPNTSQTFIDLGSGDGRVLRLASQEYGVNAIGYEVVLWPYLESVIKNWVFFKKHPQLKEKIIVHKSSAYTADVATANYIFLYTSPIFNEKIAPKLRDELTKGTKIVSLTFPLPGWEARNEYEVQGMKYWVYEVE